MLGGTLRSTRGVLGRLALGTCPDEAEAETEAETNGRGMGAVEYRTQEEQRRPELDTGFNWQPESLFTGHW